MYPTLHIFFVVTFAFPSIEIHLAVCIFMRINDVLFIYVVHLCFSSMLPYNLLRTLCVCALFSCLNEINAIHATVLNQMD